MEIITQSAWWNWPETTQLKTVFADAEQPLWFVGGAVRDAILGRRVTDVDACTSATPDAVMALCEAAGLSAIPTGIEHGTVTVVVNKRTFEITTLRADIACDGRHAEVAFATDWREDAARRDFTMNALYVDAQNGALLDAHDGVADAKAGIIRFIGEPADRIKEDALRMLRMMRFYAHYGKAPLAENALAACKALAPMLGNLSGERIAKEMWLLLSSARAWEVLSLMQQAEMLRPLNLPDALPEAAELPEQMDATGRLVFWLISVDAARAEEALKHLRARWKWSNDDEHHLREILAAQTALPDAPMPVLKELIRKHGKALANQAWAVFGATAGKRAHHMVADGFATIDMWDAPEFPLRGKDLLERGYDAGPALGAALRRAEAAWVKSDYTASKEELLRDIQR